MDLNSSGYVFISNTKTKQNQTTKTRKASKQASKQASKTNAENKGKTKTKTKWSTYHIFRGKCFQHIDPLCEFFIKLFIITILILSNFDKI